MKKKPLKAKKVTIDSLAIMVAKGFESLEGKMGKMEGDIVDIKGGMKRMNQDILNLGEKYISRFEFDNLAGRVSRIEGKDRTKVLKR